MSDEQKEAIDKLKSLVEYLKEEKIEYIFQPYDFRCFETILNYIYELQRENRNYSNTIAEMIRSKEDNYISKDNIRIEIEELKNMEVEGEVFGTARDFAIKVLRENILKETPEIRLRKYEEDIDNLINRIENGELRLYPNSDANKFLLNILKDIGKGV